MNLLFLFCVCVLVFAGLFVGIKGGKRFYPAKYFSDQEMAKASVLYAGFFVGGALLYISSFWSASAFLTWILGGMAALGIEASSFTHKWKISLSFLLCFGAAINLCPLLENGIGTILMLTLVLWGGWRLFVRFDRFFFTSSIVCLSWLIAFVLVGIFMRNSLLQMFIGQIGLLGTGVIALIYCGYPVLGKLAASLVGFMWVGIWGYFLAQGAVSQTIVGWGYYLFEAIVLGIAFIRHRPLRPLLESLAEHPKFGSKAISIVFSHLLILSFLSAMTIRMNAAIGPVLFFVLLVVLIDLYMRLTGIENPQPTWQELFKNTKMSLIACAEQLKQTRVLNTKKTVKQDSPEDVKKTSKKSPVRKTTNVKKKVVHKK